jgi:hypothetical protein
MFTKSVIALAVIVGVTSGVASPSFAKQHHPRTHAISTQGYSANDYGAFALAPHSRLTAPNADESAPYSLPAAVSPMKSWDAYGQRWD